MVHDASEDGTGRGTPVVAFDGLQITSRTNCSNPQPGDPCHTLHGGGGLLVQPYHVRRITPTEAETLQGFPQGWTAWGIDENGKRIEFKEGPRYRMMGNAVTVSVAAWLAKRIMKVLSKPVASTQRQGTIGA